MNEHYTYEELGKLGNILAEELKTSRVSLVVMDEQDKAYLSELEALITKTQAIMEAYQKPSTTVVSSGIAT